MKRPLWILLFVMAFLIQGVSAVPVINDWQGDISEGENITISGQNFGSQGPNVILFDDFKRGTNGESITTNATMGSWTSVNNGDPQYIDDGTGNIAWMGIGKATGTDQAKHSLDKNFTESESVFTSYRTMVPSGYYFPAGNEPNSLDVHKGSCWKAAWFMYEKGTYGTDDGQDICMFTYVNTFTLGGNDFHTWVSVDGFYDPNETWNRHASIFQYTGDRLNDPVWLWQQGVSETNGQATSSNSKDYYSDYDQGLGYVNIPGWYHSSDYGETRVLYDDVYIATGGGDGEGAAARVEIGNKQNYSDCTKLAITTPTKWSDNEITTTVREGTFNEGEQAYLFVVDSENNASEGYPITIGESHTQGPVIVSVEGNLTHGNSVSISGSGFGVKKNAEPILWDDFNSGVDGDYLEDHSEWVSYSGSGAEYSSTMPYGNQGLCAYNYVEYGNEETGGFDTNYFLFQESNEIYYSYISRYEGTGAGVRVYKNGRINSGDNRYNGDGSFAISDGYVLYTPGGSTVYPEGRHFDEVDIGSSDWQRHQLYSKLSDPAGTENGVVMAQVGKEKKLYENVITRREGYSFKLTSVLLGLMMANSESGDNHHMYVDDVYVDNTRARVELCNETNWSKNIKCEIQIPQQWNEGEITFGVNQGSFQEGDTAYLYAIDENGNVNEQGYPVTISPSGNQTQYHPADTDENATVEFKEIKAYLNNWLNGNVSIDELISGFKEWKDGS